MGNTSKVRLVVLLAALGCASIASAQTLPSNYTYGYRYDAVGRVVGVISADPDGTWNGGVPFQAVRNTYDTAGRLTRRETGSLNAWQSEAVAVTDWSGFVVYTIEDNTYDSMGRKTSETLTPGAGSPNNSVRQKFTQYSYDERGLLECTAVRMNPAFFGSLATGACSLSAASNYGQDRITRNIYDAAGQLRTVQKAYGTAVQQNYVAYEYTPNGKQQAVIDANGNRAELVWNGFDRQSAWRFPSKSTAGMVSDSDYEAYVYDDNGNRTELRKRDGRTISYTYDNLNRVLAKTYPNGGARSVYYSYDLRGLQTAARFDSATGGDAVLSSWNGFGEQIASTTAMGGISRTLSFQYNADSVRTRVTYPDNRSVDYVRYDTDQLYYSAVDGAGLFHTPLDAAGRVAALYRIGVTPATAPWSFSTQYGYDGISRVSSANHLFSSGGNLLTVLGYNPASQIVELNRNNSDYMFDGYVNVSRSYNVNGLNQYDNAGQSTFTYDANGNLVSDGTRSYSYDIENRLVSGPNDVQLTYDPSGRIWRSTGGSRAATQFLYDGDALVAEYDDAGAMIERYVHSDSPDDPLVQYSGAGMSDPAHLFADHQGSIVAITNAAGTVSQVNRYDEYGIPGSGNAGRFQYTGQVWMPELGMYYYKARFYSPTMGRFMQTDPIGYNDQINLYAYVGNDPINRRDPTGMAEANTCSRVGATSCSGTYAVAELTQSTIRPTTAPVSKEGAARTERAVGFAENGESQGSVGSTLPGWKLALALKARRDAVDSAENRYGHGGYTHADAGDAYRHGVLAIRLSRSIGEQDARRILNAHERSSPTERGDRLMDLINNHNAIVLGNRNPELSAETVMRLGIGQGLFQTSIVDIEK